MSQTGALALALSPLDAARAGLYRLAGPLASPWVRDRSTRVAVLGVLSVAIALALAVGLPLWLLALSPIVLGVAHVLADVRYLWVQPGYHRSKAVWLLVVPLLAVGAVTNSLLFGLLACAAALFAVPSTFRRRAMGLTILLPLCLLAYRYSTASTVIFAHLHNLIALVLWWTLIPKRPLRQAWVLVAFAAACCAIFAGAFDSVATSFALSESGPGHRPLAVYAHQLAPFASEAWGLRIILMFAFAQSVHYAVWLRLVPEDARPRRAPRPFASSARAVLEDLSKPVVIIFALSAVAVAVWACADLLGARDGYLRFAVFHGHLEIAAATLLFAGGRPQRLAH